MNPAELQNLREKIHDLEDERGELTAKISSANDELQNVQSWLQENMHLREQVSALSRFSLSRFSFLFLPFWSLARGVLVGWLVGWLVANGWISC